MNDDTHVNNGGFAGGSPPNGGFAGGSPPNGGFAGGAPPHVCITCSDQMLRLVVESVDDEIMVARGSIEGEPAEIGIELIDGVHPGDVLLCHGGVALQRVTEATGIEIRL